LAFDIAFVCAKCERCLGLSDQERAVGGQVQCELKLWQQSIGVAEMAHGRCTDVPPARK